MIKSNCLKISHFSDEFPQYPCPTCGSALLKAPKGPDFYQSAMSKSHQDHVEDSIEYYGGLFNLLLNCSDPNCSEKVLCVGSFQTIERNTAHHGVDYECSLKPEFFTPTIRIFTTPENLSEKVLNPLLEAFALFWKSPNASGSALRKSIEALLDVQRVKKSSTTKKGKRHTFTLHQRIKEFEKVKPEPAIKLRAIKWVGNDGSHAGGLKVDELVQAFYLMEYVLDLLFKKTSKRLTRDAERIIRRKEP